LPHDECFWALDKHFRPGLLREESAPRLFPPANMTGPKVSPGGPQSRVRQLLWDVIHGLPEITLSARTHHRYLSFSNKDTVIGKLLFLERQMRWTMGRSVRPSMC
jgi:hypothetical protein